MAARILIVEDDKHFASQLGELLEFHGHEPELTHTGRDGLTAFEARPPDMVLLDVMLPEMHGIRVLEHIRELPQGVDVPVLLMSAVYRSERHFGPDIQRLGVLGFLAKPFSLLEIGRRIDDLIDDPDGGRQRVRSLVGLESEAVPAPPMDAAAAPPTEAAEPTEATEASPAPPSRPRSSDRPTFRLTSPGKRRAPTLAEVPALMRKSVGAAPAARPGLPADGELSPSRYVQLLTTLFHAHGSGRLVLRGYGPARTIFLLNGYSVWAERDEPGDGLPGFLVAQGQVDAGDVADLLTYARDRKLSVRAAAVELGLVKPMQLSATMEGWVTSEVQAGLGLRGRFEYAAGDDFAGSRPVYEVNPVRALWEGLDGHVEVSEVDTELTELQDRALGRTRSFNRLFGYLVTSPRARELSEFLTRPRSASELKERFADEDARRCLWFLLRSGLISVSDAPRADSQPGVDAKRRARRRKRLQEQLSRAAKSDPLVQTARYGPETVKRLRDAKARRDHTPDREMQIVRDYVTRIDLDHYAFLSVPPTATFEELQAAYDELAPRYRLKDLDHAHPDTRRKAKELLHRLVQIYDELSHTARRADYDRRLDEHERASAVHRSVDLEEKHSTKPIPEVPSGEWTPGDADPRGLQRRAARLPLESGDQLLEAHKALKAGTPGRAVELLEALRRRHPSDSGVLADLGWCRWAVGPHDETTLKKALEWVDLAIAFKPDNAPAREAKARILVHAGSPGAADAVESLLRLNPESAWGRAQRHQEPAPELAAKGMAGISGIFRRRK